MKVTRSYTWPMGHRLALHQGRCRSVHGHNWTAEITVVGAEGYPYVQCDDRPDCGMVMDFSDLDAHVKPVVDEWDHAFMVHDRDPFARLLREFGALVEGQRVVEVPFTPTSENIAAHLWHFVDQAVAPTHRCAMVRVSESARSWAEWRLEDA